MVCEGRVSANGRMVSTVSEKYDADTVSLCVDGKAVQLQSYVYVMLNKPAGFLSATQDKWSRTVLDLLPPEYRARALFPVGRLDKDTEGLLLLTDDGSLAHALLSPRKHVDKRYYVRVDGVLDENDREAFTSGMTLGGKLVCLPADLEIISSGAVSEALVTLREGKFHQVKRMFATRGKTVCYLKRLAMGPLQLDASLAPGSWRELTEDEIRRLK